MSATLYDINSSNYFNDFVQSTYTDLGEPSNYSPEYIAYWYIGNSNLGKLNTLLDTDYSGSYATGVSGVVTGYDLSPDLGGEEQAIYKKLFELEFYNKQAKFTLNGVGGSDSSSDWTTLKEGDSTITRLNRNEVAKTFRSLAQDCKAELDELIRSYFKFNNVPEQVTGDDTEVGRYYFNNYSLDRNRAYDSL